MNDFIRLKDEVIDGAPEYTITEKPNGKYEIELANTIVNNGTQLSKSGLNILNSVTGYNKINGEYDPTSENMNYTLPIYDLTDLDDNQRLLVKPSIISAPPIASVEQILAPTQMASSVQSSAIYWHKQIVLSNGNFFAVCTSSSNNLSINVFDKKGTQISSLTGGVCLNPQLLELDDGNVLICGNNTASTKKVVAYITQPDGTAVKNATLETSNDISKICKLKNGNIIIVTINNSNYAIGYCIISQSLEVVTSYTEINRNAYNSDCSIIPLDNNGAIIVDNDSSWNCWISIIGANGSIQTSKLNIISDNYQNRALKLSNGNILIGQKRYSISDSKFVIINQQGVVLYEFTLSNTDYINFIELPDGNIFIIGQDKIAIVSTNGIIITEKTISGITWSGNSTNLKLYNGCIIFSNSKGLATLSLNGNVTMPTTILGSDTTLSDAHFDVIDNYISIIYEKSSYSYYYDIKRTIWRGIQASNEVSLNGVPIDTTLLDGKFYELVYNQSQNKFIAQEVRN